ncbi:hypothetical protein Tco_0905101 [Tanacetum coccineum]
MAVDHLSRLENPNIGELAEDEITDKFPDEHLMILKAKLNDEEPWYADYINDIKLNLEHLGTLQFSVPLGDITVPQLQEEKFTRQDSIGPVSLKMLKIM